MRVSASGCTIGSLRESEDLSSRYHFLQHVLSRIEFRFDDLKLIFPAKGGRGEMSAKDKLREGA